MLADPKAKKSHIDFSRFELYPNSRSHFNTPFKFTAPGPTWLCLHKNIILNNFYYPISCLSMFLLSTSENVLLIVSAFGLLQGIFSGLLLYFYPNSDRSVNRFLTLYVVALTLPIILPLVQHLFSWQIISLIEPLITLIPAFLYLYVRSFREVITWKKAWPHFVLFIVCIPLALWVYIAVGSKHPVSEKIPEEAKKNMLLMVPFSIRLLQRIVYYFLSLRALKLYQRSIVHLFSDTSNINLNWIKWLINGFLFLIFTSMAAYFLMIRYPEYFDWWVLISAVIVSLYIFMAAFKGMTQTTLWQMNPNINKKKLEEEINNAVKMASQELHSEKAIDSRNRMTDTKIQEIAARILAVMENEKIYQEPDLTLQSLADKIRFPSYQVSQAINDGMKKNFYDFINAYRVEEAKRLLVDPKSKNYTILSVGFEAGFNSKTTFNTVFKKFTGFTPTDFRAREKQLAVPA